MNLFPLEINEVLPHKLFYSLSQTVEEDLSYGDTGTPSPYDSALFGTRDVHKLIFYEAAVRLKLKIQKILKRDLDISRIRVNATVGGQEADWHVDSTVEGTWAAVIYTSLSWDPAFSGSTVIHNPQNGSYSACVYLPNKAIVFPATWDHAITTTTLKKNCFRTSLGIMFVEPKALPKLLESNPSLSAYHKNWGK